MSGKSPSRENVFINCPFDKDYQPLLRALLFTAIDCGLEPRIASERADSGEVRLEKIKQLIQACQFSIHDISRMEPLKEKGDLPRFNMPFELGLDLGARAFGRRALTSKQCLILEKERYRYQKVLSDISGNDIEAHGGDVETLVRVVRTWIYKVTKRKIPGPTRIWQRLNEFYSHLEIALEKEGFSREDLQNMDVSEFIDEIKWWRKEH